MRRLVARLDGDPLVAFLLCWAIAFGGLVRLYPVLTGDFPLNDGGLFYVMVEDLKAANYRLPFYTTYNEAQIPFAYPPLPFYLAAALSDLFGIPLLQIFRWLPATMTLLTIPAFYLLARTFLKSRMQGAIATVAFAMLPSSFDWLVMGGGLTRVLGYLFSMLTLYGTFALLTRHGTKYLVVTLLAATALALSHPEAMLHTAFAAGLIWLLFGRNKEASVRSLVTAVGVVLLTAPWWGTVLTRHGWSPFLAASQTGWHSLLFWVRWLSLNFTNESLMSLIALLGIIGAFVCLARRQYWLPIWLLLPSIVEPRSAPLYAVLPVSLLAAVGAEIVLEKLADLEQGSQMQQSGNQSGSGKTPIAQSPAARAFLGLFLISTLLSACIQSQTLSGLRLSSGEIAASNWIRNSTPPRARLLIVTFGEPLSTPIQEWFPALSRRVSLTAVQGYEWLPGDQFSRRREEDFPALQKCLFEDVQCIEDWASARGYTFDYVYVYQRLVGAEDGGGAELRLGQWLVHTMDDSPDYTRVYDAPDIKIFAHNGD